MIGGIGGGPDLCDQVCDRPAYFMDVGDHLVDSVVEIHAAPSRLFGSMSPTHG
jgi:hypothetical protein